MDILEFNINYQLILSVVGTVLAVLLAFLILQFFWLRAKVNRLYRKYKYFMMGEDGGSIEMKLSTEVRELGIWWNLPKACFISRNFWRRCS